jgi:23S rRNA pseudouridine1911/1915/1917 synthase
MDELVRIDKFLSTFESEHIYSRSQIEKLISNNKVKVNGKVVKKNYKLEANDKIEIEFEAKQVNEIIPENIPIDIVYQDDYLAVVNKPIGLVVHPGNGNPDGTLANALAYHFGSNLSQTGGNLRPGIVHRLDKGTSGLIIIAKTDDAHVKLSEMFKNREIDKTYRAILVGHMKEEQGTIETLYARSRRNAIKYTVAQEGKVAVTHYNTLKKFHYFSYVDVKLETGRTHQIRVHFSHYNCPVLGDRLYSGLEEVASRIPYNYKKRLKNLFDRTLSTQALHAYKLEFIHPITNENICVESTLPDYFLKTLDWLDANFAMEE